ncbi:hypothetical protein L286_23085 [Sphingobium sp. HDIP04]|nr:hypothetical protein L286_23085 [Sphingobium sp. HDIP04]
MCRVLQVSERGYRSWRSRPISRRERTDMKVLAHIREQYSLSLGSYGRPRMTMELKDAGINVGERRVGRLMRINGIKSVRPAGTAAIFQYINGFYNSRRRHSYLGGISPLAFEAKVA